MTSHSMTQVWIMKVHRAMLESPISLDLGEGLTPRGILILKSRRAVTPQCRIRRPMRSNSLSLIIPMSMATRMSIHQSTVMRKLLRRNLSTELMIGNLLHRELPLQLHLIEAANLRRAVLLLIVSSQLHLGGLWQDQVCHLVIRPSAILMHQQL